MANAAVGADFDTQIPSEELATSTLRTNVTSTIDFIKQFLSVLSPTGRAVAVSSTLGAFNLQTKEFVQRIDNPKITEQEILGIV